MDRRPLHETRRHGTGAGPVIIDSSRSIVPRIHPSPAEEEEEEGGNGSIVSGSETRNSKQWSGK